MWSTAALGAPTVGALENPSGIDAGLAIRIDEACRVADQAAGSDIVTDVVSVHTGPARLVRTSSSLWRPHGAKSLHCRRDRSGDSCSARCRREHLLFSAINDHSGLDKHGRHM